MYLIKNQEPGCIPGSKIANSCAMALDQLNKCSRELRTRLMRQARIKEILQRTNQLNAMSRLHLLAKLILE
jgi:hypothetical protein